MRGGAACVATFAFFTLAATLPNLSQGAKLRSPVTDQHLKVYVADLDPVLNFRTMFDYNVSRFFTQFGADPMGVWSNPVGDYVTERDGMELRNTYMYGLDVMFHRQLLQSPLRVHSMAEADAVFIPIYTDIGCRLSQVKPADKAAWRAATDAFWATFPDRFPDVKSKPHFVVTGRREAENMGGCGISGIMYGKVEACDFLCHPYAADLIMLTVEVLSNNLEIMGPKPLRPSSVTVPWPGHWHLTQGSPYFSAPFDPEAHAASKEFLAMESLRVRLPLRELLFKSCSERSDACLHYHPRGEIRGFNQSEIYSAVKSAWYCIQPPGDGPTRHATMDCLAAGSLPLFFDQHITAVMPFADVLNYAEFTEFIDPNLLIESQANAIDILEAAFDAEAGMKAAKRLHQVKHVFLYAVNPEHSLLRFSEMYSIHPMDDAFTASMKAMMRTACKLGTLPLSRCSEKAAAMAAASSTAPSSAPQALNRDYIAGTGPIVASKTIPAAATAASFSALAEAKTTGAVVGDAEAAGATAGDVTLISAAAIKAGTTAAVTEKDSDTAPEVGDTPVVAAVTGVAEAEVDDELEVVGEDAVEGGSISEDPELEIEDVAGNGQGAQPQLILGSSSAAQRLHRRSLSN